MQKAKERHLPFSAKSSKPGGWPGLAWKRAIWELACPHPLPASLLISCRVHTRTRLVLLLPLLLLATRVLLAPPTWDFLYRGTWGRMGWGRICPVGTDGMHPGG